MISSKYAILFLAVLLMLSCSSSKKAQSDTTKTEDVKDNKQDNYRLTVVFFSPGNGIDHKMKQKYVEFIRDNYPKVVYENTQWGKEGEVTFCIPLNELEGKEKDQFVKESKELLSASSRVHIYENAPCGNKN